MSECTPLTDVLTFAEALARQLTLDDRTVDGDRVLYHSSRPDAPAHLEVVMPERRSPAVWCHAGEVELCIRRKRHGAYCVATIERHGRQWREAVDALVPALRVANRELNGALCDALKRSAGYHERRLAAALEEVQA